jgi:Domain of unknown function (DUF6259)
LGLVLLAALCLGLVGTPAVSARSKASPPSAEGIRFTQLPRRNQLRITTSAYELTLSRKNGAILSVVDRAARTRVIVGQGGCIWGARAEGTADYIGGCTFSRTGAARFSYTWNARSATLTLSYAARPGSPAAVSATALLTARGTYFDLRVTVKNQLHRVLSSVLVPADLLGPSAGVTSAYVPNFLPGIRLAPSFFKGAHSNVLTYPGRYAWADYLALDLGAGHLAVYSANPPPNPLYPVELGFVHSAAGTFCSDRLLCIVHSFYTSVADGAGWTSPAVRIRVGETLDKTLLGYRKDNGIDAYPSVADRLGSEAPMYERAPLIKADVQKGLPPLSQWAQALRRLPSPVLLHPVRYQRGLFDEFDPDFLPPDPHVGSVADLAGMVSAAHSLGQLVMPYLNVSWWNVDSPTVQQLLAKGGAERFAALDESGRPKLEAYKQFMGYIVSPYTPAVRDRIRALMDQWQAEAPMDCYFFDQIGARPWIRDYNPAAPDPLSYYDGWLAAMAPYAPRCLMVEDGWDRLAKSFAGFLGGLLTVQRESAEADILYGAGNWEPFPLAPMLLHDKVLMYQHDLAEQTMTTDHATLTYNLALGLILSYSWDGSTYSVDSPWLDVVTSYQHALGPYSAGQPLQSYKTVAPQVTQTDYPNLSVLANWSSSDGYSTDGYGIAPNGFLARTGDGAVVAGTFSGTFDGFTLAGGSHDLVVTRTSSAVTVHQPLGDQTPIAVRLPSSWQAGSPVHAAALASDGSVLQQVSGTVQNGRFVFTCAAAQAGAPSPTYRITVG